MSKDKPERDERDRKEKAERVEKDRVETARKSERARMFEEVLSSMGTRAKGCCEPCNYYVRKDNGEPQRCKIGHKDAGPDKEVCADCSGSRYHLKK